MLLLLSESYCPPVPQSGAPFNNFRRAFGSLRYALFVVPSSNVYSLYRLYGTWRFAIGVPRVSQPSVCTSSVPVTKPTAEIIAANKSVATQVTHGRLEMVRTTNPASSSRAGASASAAGIVGVCGSA